MPGEVKLDQDTFKALAGETRVKILKSLKERKKYLSELSEELEMSNSSVKEQLDNLVEAGLIEKEEERKWKYYKLTRKGNKIMKRKKAKAYILLSSSILAGLVGLFLFLRNKIIQVGTGIGAAGGKTASKAVETVNETNETMQEEFGELAQGAAKSAPETGNKAGEIISKGNETVNQSLSNATAENVTQKGMEGAVSQGNIFTSPEFLLMVIGFLAAILIILWIRKNRV